MESLKKLDLDTQSETFQGEPRPSSVFLCGEFIGLLVSLESEKEGLVQLGHHGLDSTCLCGRVFLYIRKAPCMGHGRNRITNTVDLSLHIVTCQVNHSVLPPGFITICSMHLLMRLMETREQL